MNIKETKGMHQQKTQPLSKEIITQLEKGGGKIHTKMKITRLNYRYGRNEKSTTQKTGS